MINQFFLSILVAGAAIAWALVLSAFGWAIPLSFFRPLSVIAGLLSLALLVFDLWAWAWPGVRSLINRPDLRGTWQGVIRSSWKHPDEHRAKLGTIKTYVIVHQTYTGLHLRLLTHESHSSSISAVLVAGSDGSATVYAMYQNNSRASLRSQSPIHRGGLILHVGGPPPTSMEGDYWTDRQTSGEIELLRISSKRVQDYRAAEALESDEG
jgi:hypothetical protein